jgi:hypothetical protein
LTLVVHEPLEPGQVPMSGVTLQTSTDRARQSGQRVTGTGEVDDLEPHTHIGQQGDDERFLPCSVCPGNLT